MLRGGGRRPARIAHEPYLLLRKRDPANAVRIGDAPFTTICGISAF